MMLDAKTWILDARCRILDKNYKIFIQYQVTSIMYRFASFKNNVFRHLVGLRRSFARFTFSLSSIDGGTTTIGLGAVLYKIQ